MTSYYTPEHWAKILVKGLCYSAPRGIVDPAVGDGSLLICCSTVFPNTKLLGVDVDPIAVAKSKKALPNALVSRANSIKLSSLSRSKVWRHRRAIDTVVMNPPFAGQKSAYSICFRSDEVSCGIAGAFLLDSVVNYAPTRIAAIMPSSFFHSERDAKALSLICREYDMIRGEGLHRSAFTSGNASSEIVHFRRKLGSAYSRGNSARFEIRPTAGQTSEPVHLIRGGVPVHIAKTSLTSRGVPFLHTTELIRANGSKKMIVPRSHGIVSGFVILLPRVGFPRIEHLEVRFFRVAVQLSDCVIGICFASSDRASEVCSALRQDFENLGQCWAGTGAPYTTMSKLSDYFHRLGIDCRTDLFRSHTVGSNSVLSKTAQILDGFG